MSAISFNVLIVLYLTRLILRPSPSLGFIYLRMHRIWYYLYNLKTMEYRSWNDIFVFLIWPNIWYSFISVAEDPNAPVSNFVEPSIVYTFAFGTGELRPIYKLYCKSVGIARSRYHWQGKTSKSHIIYRFITGSSMSEPIIIEEQIFKHSSVLLHML